MTCGTLEGTHMEIAIQTGANYVSRVCSTGTENVFSGINFENVKYIDTFQHSALNESSLYKLKIKIPHAFHLFKYFAFGFIVFILKKFFYFIRHHYIKFKIA